MAGGDRAPRQKKFARLFNNYKTLLLLTAHSPEVGVGPRIRCHVYGGSAPRAFADKFLQTPCHQGLFNGFVMIPQLPIINGHQLHPRQWGSTVCFGCGCIATQAVRNLKKQRSTVVDHYGRQQLRKLVNGQPPGTSKLSKQLLAKKRLK